MKIYFPSYNTNQNFGFNFLKHANDITSPFLKQTGEDCFVKSGYENLDEDTKNNIRKKAKKRHIKAANINIELGLDLKRAYDKKYGEDGYVFVSIGTSPAPIAKVLECLGVEVKYLPISNLGGKTKEHQREILENCDFSNYFEMLRELGITADEMKKSGKKYIFSDYTKTGATLSVFHKLLVEKMKLPKECMDFRSLNFDLVNFSSDKTAADNYIKDYLYYAYSADYSQVDHLSYTKIGDNKIDPEKYNRKGKKDVKYYNFMVMDTLSRLGLMPKSGSDSLSFKGIGKFISFRGNISDSEPKKSLNEGAVIIDEKQEFFEKPDKLQIRDYMQMSAIAKEEVRDTTLNIIQEAIDDSTTAGIKYKEFLDKKYGEDGYIFVSIGVSPSLIAKVLECMGVETRYCPISQLSREYDTLKDFDFTNYFNFLKTQGISPKEIEKSDKKFVFCDYTGSGFTLNNFERLMIEKLGLNPSKCDFRSANRDMKEFMEDKRFASRYIDRYFRLCDSQYYSGIAHLSVLTIEDMPLTRKRLTNHEKPAVKRFNFGVMDKLNEMGLLKENPANEHTL